MGTPGNPIVTERQAMIAIANQLSNLVLTAAADGSITFEGAIAIVAGALAQAGASNYTPGEINSLTLNTLGQVRVATTDEVAPLVPRSSPWGARGPW